jgi:hypothetical protein
LTSSSRFSEVARATVAVLAAAAAVLDLEGALTGAFTAALPFDSITSDDARPDTSSFTRRGGPAEGTSALAVASRDGNGAARTGAAAPPLSERAAFEGGGASGEVARDARFSVSPNPVIIKAVAQELPELSRTILILDVCSTSTSSRNLFFAYMKFYKLEDLGEQHNLKKK